MKKDQVTIGKTYRCKVSGSVADVRITGENPHGGWDGVNVATNRKVSIKSAHRLRGMTPPRPAKREVIKSLDVLKDQTPTDQPRILTKEQYEAEVRTETPTQEHETMTAKKTNTKSSKKSPAKTGNKKESPKDKSEKRPSGLDAAAQVLAEAKQPLSAKEMVERMLAKGLWKTSGKTPEATIYAAIIREIAAKGSESRFHKTERGKFELAK